MTVSDLLLHTLARAILTSFLLYVGVLLYRVYLSPLSKFPGPKLAAASDWYEFYYEFIHKGGSQFAFHIDELHRIYGPFVRITPWEIHTNDFQYYDSIYSFSHHHDKPEHLKWRAGQPNSIFATPEHNIHRGRRAALNPYFSKSRISTFIPYVQNVLENMCHRVRDEFAGKKKVLNLGDMWGCFAADTIAQYAFQREYHWTAAAADFKCPLLEGVEVFADIMHCVPLFPVLGMILYITPAWLVRIMAPGLGGAMDFVGEIELNVDRVKQADFKPREHDNPNIVYELVHSDLPDAERRQKRLVSEAMGVVSAGLETSKTALERASFRIFNNPMIHKKLQDEIATIWIRPESAIPDLAELEALPYLAACVEEAFRLSYGTPTRLPRVPRQPLSLGDHVIPAGYMISTQALSVLHDEDVFPSPLEYIPERWTDPSTFPLLKSHLVTFGRGTRVCIGRQLAYAQMTLGIATLVRRVDLSLFETDRSDVDLVRASFKPRPKKGSLGIRALVHSVSV